jgi:hypothetical protein
MDVQHILGHERASITDRYLPALGFNALRGAAELMEDCAEAESAQSGNPLK